MNRGYQSEDFHFTNYNLWCPRDCENYIRGPAIDLVPGSYIVAIGAAQTFGRFVDDPYPARLSRQLGLPVLNLGISGAGPSFFFMRPDLLKLINQAKLAIVQVMSGRSLTNSRFIVESNQGLVRIAGAPPQAAPIFAEHAYQNFIQTASKDEAAALRAEIRARYIAEMQGLLDAVHVPKILFWFSTRTPEWNEGLNQLESYWGAYPHFINQAVFDSLDVGAKVLSVTDEGLPQILEARDTGVTAGMWPRSPFSEDTMRRQNRYYPSPEMHRAAETALLPAVSDMLRNQSPMAPAIVARRSRREVLVHMHIFKNAGTSVDVMLQQSLGDRFAEIDPAEAGACLTQHDLARELELKPHLQALSSHQLRQPLAEAGPARLIPYIMLRHPIDRLHSIWKFERTPERQAAPVGLITEWAAALDFAAFIDQCLQSEWTQSIISNYQTRLCGTVLAEGETEQWNTPTGPAHMLEAMRFLDRIPSVGVVERFGCSIRHLHATTRLQFPALRPIIVHSNQSYPESPPEKRRQMVAAELGKTRYEALLDLNAMDLALHRMAMARLGKAL